MTRAPRPPRVVVASELTVDDVVARFGTDGADKASLYLPTHVAGRDVTQDPTRLRRMLGLVEDELTTDLQLDDARALVTDHDFWQHGSQALAVLIEAGSTTAIRLPEPVEELAVVSDRFHLKPLLRAIANTTRFDVLALSRHAVRLVRDVGTGATDVEVPGLPSGMPDALRWDDRERQIQTHAAGRVGSGRVTAAFHGGGGEARISDLERFLQMVDRAVVSVRSDTTLPLVLAGTDDLVAAYRKVTRCRDVVDHHLPGNPDRLTAAELAERARQFVPSPGSQREQRAGEAYLTSSAATVDTVEQAVLAAAAGHVASIFVPADREFWGRFTPGHALLLEHDEREPGDHDLADVAAAETIRHGGAAFVVPAADVPGGGAVAATLHF
jgi:hypothetical protein